MPPQSFNLKELQREGLPASHTRDSHDQENPLNDTSSSPSSSEEEPPATRTKRSWLLTVLSIVAVAGVITGIAFMGATSDRPQTGDCLGSLKTGAFGSMAVVDCSGSDAAYEVVAHVESGMVSQVQDSICDGHSGGEAHVQAAVKQKNRVEWAICAVPL